MAILVLVGLCGLLCGQGWSATVQQATITAHNNARRTEAKAEHATNMYELVWDAALAQNAAAWADKCVEQHQGFTNNRGENLYYAYPKTQADDHYITEAVNWWMREKSLNTDGSFNCCFNGHFTCCHYTQIVSARTRRVGCAVHQCPELRDQGHSVIAHNAAFVVCEYSPSGNWAVNGHYSAYSKGTTCSHCDAGDHCNDGLCVH